MRSKFFVCVALASLGLAVGVTRTAHAADSKAKGSKKGDDTDKGISKTLSWEEKVLGEDDKRAELDKILKAQAINKAATEKAEREKAQREKEEAARAAREAAAPKNQKKGGEVALPSMPDEGVNKSKVKPTEISPKLDTAAAAAAPPPSKPADDKFIDKLLKEEGSGKKKRAAATADNNELLDILSTDKKTPGKPKGKAASEVDKALLEVDKPVAPMAKVHHETPEWQKPEIQNRPVAVAIPAPQPRAKKDDGIVRVVQGAANTPSSAAPVASRPAPIATRPSPMVPAARKAPPAGAASGSWNDPFAEPGARKSVASRGASRSDDEDVFAPAPRRNASAPAGKSTSHGAARATRSNDDDAWEDPFDAKKAAAARRASGKPAKADPPGRWKDPFTDESSTTRSRGSVAMRESSRDSGREESAGKWEAARRAPAATDDESPAQAHGRWGVLKKRR